MLCFIKINKPRKDNEKWRRDSGKRGRKRKTTERDARMIVRQVRKDRFTSAPQIKKENKAAENISVCTIRRRIRESGEFKSYWAAKKPFISKINKKKRVQ